MFRKAALLALAALPAAVLASTPAAAQRPIRAGETVQGRLDAGDPTLDDGSHFDLYSYRGRAGERLTITLSSGDFDAYLAFGPLSGGELEADETDDDGGGGTDSRLVVTLDEDGTYGIRANTLSEGETGAYTLTVESGVAPAVQVRDIAVGQSVTGTLDDADPQADDDSYYELWRLRGRAGQTITITLRSDDFDAYLGWGTMSGGEWEEADSDDDGAGGTDSRLVVTLGDEPEYVIRANTLSGGETGTYTLTVEPGGVADDDDDDDVRPRPAASRGRVQIGQTVSGRLEESDAEAEDGSYYDEWTFTGRAGDRVVVTLRSSDFDAYLSVGEDGDEGELGSDDDSGGGTDSRVEITLLADGTYVIRANSIAPGETGAYTLIVERA